MYVFDSGILAEIMHLAKYYSLICISSLFWYSGILAEIMHLAKYYSLLSISLTPFVAFRYDSRNDTLSYILQPIFHTFDSLHGSLV